MLDYVEEKDDLHAEAYEEGEVLDLEVLNEMVDISFENSHGNPFQISFKYQPDSSPEEGYFRQLSHDEKRTEYVGGCRAFYDPIAEYM